MLTLAALKRAKVYGLAARLSLSCSIRLESGIEIARHANFSDACCGEFLFKRSHFVVPSFDDPLSLLESTIATEK